MLKKNESGQAMVEFALVLPILILIVIGIINFGWIFYNQVIANNACREAARYAAIHHSESGYKDIARDIVQDYLNITVETEATNKIKIDDTGGKAKVWLDGYKIDVLIPFVSVFIDDEFQINASTTMRLE